MEKNLPLIMTKKLCNIVRVAFFMLKKGICKNKILLNLNMMMKRGKIASKVALYNLLFHHHHHNHLHASTTQSNLQQPSHIQHTTTGATKDYILSGGDTPYDKKNGYQYHQDYFYSCKSSPIFEDIESLEIINKGVEIMLSNKLKGGFMVRQVRITDSPFPFQNEENYDHHVDKAADNFIKRFYSRLKEQDGC